MIDVPRYLILILSQFKRDSKSLEDYEKAIWYLPKNLSEDEYNKAKEIIANYLNIKGVIV
jgi:hypothetical protein